MSPKWMIYGAYGYTGRIIAREAKKRGMSPLLAGRDPTKLKALADEFGFDHLAFSLEDSAEVARNLRDLNAVLLCAGPFASTHKPVFQACLAHRIHYLDITGEIPIFEHVQSQKKQILDAGIAAIPGVGYDVVPSDCLAAHLRDALPTADHLTLTFIVKGKISPGSMKTVLYGLPAGGAIRKDGKLTLVKPVHRVKMFTLDGEAISAVTVAWADVSTAYHSTGIPNIDVYFALPRGVIKLLQITRPIRYAFAWGPIQRVLWALADAWVVGDSDEERLAGHTTIFGEATDPSGKRVAKKVTTPHGYSVTADAALLAVERVLSGRVAPGPWTPSRAFGHTFLNELTDVHISDA